MAREILGSDLGATMSIANGIEDTPQETRLIAEFCALLTTN